MFLVVVIRCYSCMLLLRSVTTMVAFLAISPEWSSESRQISRYLAKSRDISRTISLIDGEVQRWDPVNLLADICEALNDLFRSSI